MPKYVAQALIKYLPLADLLLEVDNWTGFLRHHTHLNTGMATTGSQRLILVAGLMGMGMNYSLSKYVIDTLCHHESDLIYTSANIILILEAAPTMSSR